MFLLESELGFLRYLKEARVPLNEFTFPSDRVANVQSQVLILLFCVRRLKSTISTQLEKLLQKNYFLHQSAKDGFRSYLQAYASYSLKKIFDMNALDLAKVGKAFGFAVPPRVNVRMGGGKSISNSGQKRRREENEEDEAEGEEAESETEEERRVIRRQGKERRVGTLGKKRVEREVYRKVANRKKLAGRGQWSR